MFSEDINYRAIMDQQNPFLSEYFSDLAGTQMGMLDFVLDNLILVFL